jgi:hypothetical protein
MKDKILNFYTLFELHRTNVALVQYSSKITQFMKAKQQKKKKKKKIKFIIKKKKKKSNKKKTQKEKHSN